MQSLIQFIKFLDTHSGSLTFLVTTIYVIATIFICIFNGRSARATHEQLIEMKREHQENIRLEFMPYFEINFGPFNKRIHKSTGLVHILSEGVGIELGPDVRAATNNMNLKNIGKYVATSIQLDIQYKDAKIHYPIKDLTINPGVEEYLDFFFKLSYDDVYDLSPSSSPYKSAELVIKFDDILGNHYTQTAYVSFACNPILPNKEENAEIMTKVYCSVQVVSYSVEPPILLS